MGLFGNNLDPNAPKLPPPHPWMVKWDIFLTWITPLITLSNKRQIREDDIFEPLPHAQVRYQTDLLWRCWEKEKKNVDEYNLKLKSDPNNIKKLKKYSFLNALYYAYGWDMFVSVSFQIIYVVSQIIQPFIVGMLTQFIKDGDGGIGYGIGLSICFSGLAAISSITLSFVLDRKRRLGSNIRSAIMMAVYEHSLRLTTSSRFKNSVGQTTNLMAIDSEKLNMTAQTFHYLFISPVTIISIFVILIIIIGYGPALCGFATLVAFIPLQRRYANLIGTVRRKMIKHTDNRVKLVNEMLQAIRVIKLYGWEEPIEKRISELREVETKTLHIYLDFSAKLREILVLAQPLISLVIVVIAAYAMDKPLSLVQLITVLSFLNVTRFPFNVFGLALKNYKDALVSIARLQDFFSLKTIDEINENDEVSEPKIHLQNASFTWIDIEDENNGSLVNDLVNSTFCLKNLNFSTLRSNELIAVIGPVGSGKSSFISALLGEMNSFQLNSDGKLVKDIKGKISYCSQSPWIQNLTLRQNIMFDIPIDTKKRRFKKLYKESIRAACLEPDIKILEYGDLTEIGERGINLSGGQKARVSIARSFFSSYRSQLFLFDDPFSAVDGNTGNFIFHNGIKNFLKDKLRVVVLNSHMHLLKHFDRIIVLDNGEIKTIGTFNEISQNFPDLMTKLTGFQNFSEEEKDEDTLGDLDDSTETYVYDPTDECEDPENLEFSSTTSKKKDVLIKKENIEDAVSLSSAFAAYFTMSLLNYKTILNKPIYSNNMIQEKFLNNKIKIFGAFCIFYLTVIFVGSQVFRVFVDISISNYVKEGVDGRHYWRDVFFSCFGIFTALLMVRSISLNFFSARTSKVLHSHILRKILGSPITTFFDVNSIGSILNKLSKDMETIDMNIPEFLFQFVINWLQVLSVFAMCIMASYWFVFILIPLFFLFIKVFNSFRNISSSIKLLESITRSPIFSSLNETLTGLNTIRAFNDTKRFNDNHLRMMNVNHKLFYHKWIVSSWMTLRLELSTAILLLGISLLAVCLRSSVSPTALGLALTYGLSMTALFQRSVTLVIDLTSYMTSTQRVLEYADLPQEENIILDSSPNSSASIPTSPNAKNLPFIKSFPPELVEEYNQNKPYHYEDIVPLTDIPQNWPVNGDIVFDNVWMRYRNNPPVLTGLNCKINGGETVGICGRTGAGKSTIMMTLFRIVNVMKGRILIDNVDISKVGLKTLRHHLAIIPQDPVLFSGTIRFQLDPFDSFPDSKIWEVLEKVNLKEHIQSLPLKLNEMIIENGENLSQGQKQLLCIARAFLKNCKILIIDEGTSAVDPHTNDLIQQVIKREASERNLTVLAIAHRLDTIIGFDKIMVMGKGKVLEFGDPQVLKNNPDSIFASMLRESDNASE